MAAGLNVTFQFLAKTENEAAVDVLVTGLDCPHDPSRHGAVRALLERRSPAGHREVFQRLSTMDERSRELVDERPERLAEAVAETLQNPDPKECAAACDAIASFRLYSALPAVVSVLVEPDSPHCELMARTALKLTESFYAELSGVADQPKSKQQDIVRSRITQALEDGTRKFHRHQRSEVVEAFLMVAKQKNVTLRQLLQRPDESSHQAIVDLLSNSSKGGVLRLLLGFLEDPQMPHVASKVICNRCDVKFVDHMLRNIGSRLSKNVAETIIRFDSIAWAEPEHKTLKRLSSAGQEGAVQLLMGSSVERERVREVIGYLLLKGRPAGRRAAAKALAEFKGPEAAALTVQALGDQDPEVQAAIITQIRPRRIPGAMSLLIRMMDSLDERVRAALRQAMPEFTFRQFLTNFDSMAEQLQHIAGHMVQKIDSRATDKLIAEMTSQSPVRRRRAVLAAGAMGLIMNVEKLAISLLSDEDHMVRVAVAKALADCKSMPSWDALRDALLDRSIVVQEAAEKSLEQISRSLLQHREEAETDEFPEAENGEAAEGKEGELPEEVTRQ